MLGKARTEVVLKELRDISHERGIPQQVLIAEGLNYVLAKYRKRTVALRSCSCRRANPYGLNCALKLKTSPSAAESAASMPNDRFAKKPTKRPSAGSGGMARAGLDKR